MDYLLTIIPTIQTILEVIYISLGAVAFCAIGYLLLTAPKKWTP